MSLNQFRNREERARFDAGERQELEVKLAPIKAGLTANLKKANAAARLFFNQPLRHLADLIDSQMFEADRGVTYPSTTEIQTGMRGRDEYTEFVANLPKSGFLLSAAGAQRLLLYVIAQAYSENHADMADPQTWRLAFDRLLSLKCFDEARAEIGYDENIRVQEPVAAQPEYVPSLDDLEHFNTTSKEGEKLAHKILADAVFGPQGESRQVWHEWLRSIATNFGHDLTEEEQKEAILWFTRNNKSFLDRRAFDLCRLNLVRRGILNHGCLTPDELFSMGIEDDDTQSWTGRRNLQQELAALRKQ